MHKLSSRLSDPHHHILRRTAPPATRIFSTTRATVQSKSTSEIGSERKTPNKDDVSPTSKKNTCGGTHDEVAHTNKAAYGPSTNPAEEKVLVDVVKAERPGSQLEYSAEASHQGENKRPEAGMRDRSKASGEIKNA